MIRINLQTQENLALNRAIANAVNQLRGRSFSGRHPDLGKMTNCQVCGNRHRSTVTCTANYVDTPGYGISGFGQQTSRGVYGAASVKGKRIKPHHNSRDLQLIELTREYFPIFETREGIDEKSAMKLARTKAARVLRRIGISKKIARKLQQDISRRINAGLLPGGSR